jgi:hypothetical protein
MRHCSHLDLEVAMHGPFDVAEDELADWPDQVIESWMPKVTALRRSRECLYMAEHGPMQLLRNVAA